MATRARNPERERVVEFVRHRLNAMVRDSDRPHGKAAAIARELHISAAHMSNVLKGKAGIGEDMRKQAARLLGFSSVAQLEAAALGRPVPAPPGELDYRNPSQFAAIVRAIARDMGIGDLVVAAFLSRADAHGIPSAEHLATELRILDGILAASRPDDDDDDGPQVKRHGVR